MRWWTWARPARSAAIPAVGRGRSGWKTRARPARIAERIPLTDRAVATAGGYGTLFDAAGRFNHIFEPWSGRASWRWLSVSVEAPPRPNRTSQLSNAFALMPEEATATLVRARRLVAHSVRPDGARLVQRE